jgi:protease-4
MTAIGRDKTPQELELLQQSVDIIYKQFFNTVLLNRKGKKGLTEEILKKYADGRILTGIRASDIGLVDSIGGMKEGIEYIKARLKIKGEIRVIDDSKSMLERFFSILNSTKPLSVDSFLKSHSSGIPLYLYVGESGL